jgi:hypothetical protein
MLSPKNELTSFILTPFIPFIHLFTKNELTPFIQSPHQHHAGGIGAGNAILHRIG